MAFVQARDWGWRYAGRDAWAVSGLDLEVEAGMRVLLLGASGAGKSTLLLALAGVLGGSEEGTESGSLLIEGQHPTRRLGQVGLVQQDPAAQIVLATVGDDVAFGCENLGVPPEAIWPRVRASLAAVGLDVALGRSTSALSGGQQQRLALAGALAMHQPTAAREPRLLLLDEPTANLDPAGVVEVRQAVGRIVADRATTLIIVEHRVEPWMDLIDRVVVLGAAGGVIAAGSPGEVFAACGAELARAGVWVPGIPLPAELTARAGAVLRPRPADSTAPALGARSHPPALRGIDLAIGYEAAQVVRDRLEVVVPTGQSTVITGPNGSGKSTLALTLAGLLPQLGGRVVASPALVPAPSNRRQRRADLTDPHSWTSAQLLTRLGTVFQEPEHQFVAGHVRDEIAVGLRALRWAPDRIAARVEELLALLHLEALASANPFTLSGGEKRRLSVGTVLAAGPSVIILDEPTFGQDRLTWCDLVGLIIDLVGQGRTVISVTHDRAFLDILGQHRLDLGMPS